MVEEVVEDELLLQLVFSSLKLPLLLQVPHRRDQGKLQVPRHQNRPLQVEEQMLDEAQLGQELDEPQ